MRYFDLRATLTVCLIAMAVTSACTQENMTNSDIQAAGKVMGLTFEQSKIDSMRGNLQQALSDFQRNRDVSIDNSVAPALYFAPFP